MSRPRASGNALDRVVYVGRVHQEFQAEGEGPTAAVIEIDVPALHRINEGLEASLEDGWEEPRELATTEVAWTRLPSTYSGLAYEAAMLVYDAAVQWGQLVWADEGVLEGFGALPVRRSICVLEKNGFMWRTSHPDVGELWTDPLPITQLYSATMFVGTPFLVRTAAAVLASHYPDLMANALLADVGPRFGVAFQEITRRDISSLVGYDELHPMLSHESDRVRKAASEALERGPRLVS